MAPIEPLPGTHLYGHGAFVLDALAHLLDESIVFAQVGVDAAEQPLSRLIQSPRCTPTVSYGMPPVGRLECRRRGDLVSDGGLAGSTV